MSFPSRRARERETPDFLAPSEGWLLVQTTAFIGFSSWALGGVRDWSQPWILALSFLGLPLVALRYRETACVARRPFVPAILWAVFAGLALANPSHEPTPGGGWMLRPDWLRWLPGTVDAPHTIADARVWLAALVQGGVMLTVLRSARATRLLWSIIALNGFLLAAIGACFHFGGAEQVLGFIDPPERTYFFATFFYKNHWAAYGALVTTAGFAVALQLWPAALAGNPAARGKALLFGSMALLSATTLPLPGSRSGALLAIVVIAGAAGLALRQIWRSKARRGAPRALLLAASTCLALLIGAYGLKSYAPRAVVDFQRTRAQLARGLDGESLDIRVPVSRDTWRMALERPWFGWGPGTYEIVFPVFQGNYLRRPDGRPAARFEFAHNDWLQLFAENGLVGGALLIVPAFLAGRHAWMRAAAAGRWALVGCGLIAAYAWIDFPYHNPAVLILWTMLLTSAHRLAPRDNVLDAQGVPADNVADRPQIRPH